MKFKRFFAVLAMILCIVLSLGLLTSCLSDTEDSISIEKGTSGETETGKLDFINRDTTKAEETTKAPETTKTPETVKSPDTTKAPETTKEPETEKVPETTVHTHDFLLATCTAPKTCLSCGKTEGSASGHNWESATCTSPKICADCSKTEGTAWGHSYSNGSCTSCYSKDPSYVSEGMVWVPTKGGKKYHSNSDCSNMDGPRHVTKSQAIAEGFTACKRCYG